MNNTEVPDELIPIIAYHRGFKQLYFHWRRTDELFRLKNVGYHNRLKMFGSSRNIYVSMTDLVLIGKKTDLD